METLARHGVEAGLAQLTAPPPTTGNTEALRALADTCFQHDRVEAILESLQTTSRLADDPRCSPARHVIRQLQACSPTSLKVTLQQLRHGREQDLASCLTMEYRMSQAFLHGNDFYEGVRAALVDKDRQPRWSPKQLADVSEDAVNRYFDSRSGDELELTSSAETD